MGLSYSTHNFLRSEALAPWAVFVTILKQSALARTLQGSPSFSVSFILNKFYFLSTLITLTAAFHLPQLFVYGFGDRCHCQQGNLVACGSFLFNGPSGSHDRVLEKLNSKGQSLEMSRRDLMTCLKFQSQGAARIHSLDLWHKYLEGSFSLQGRGC